MLDKERIGLLAIMELRRKIYNEEESGGYVAQIKIACYKKEIEEIEEWVKVIKIKREKRK